MEIGLGRSGSFGSTALSLFLVTLGFQGYKLSSLSVDQFLSPMIQKFFPLITPEHEWNVDLIKAEFCPMGADCILGISLRGREKQDELVWHFEKNGKFSVRSAYSVACSLRDNVACSWSGCSWNFIWRSKAPPKVVMYAWCCASNAPPTTNNLRRRGVLVNDGCGDCLFENDDALHVVLSCSFARLVWAILQLPWGSLVCKSFGIDEWFRQVYRELGRQDWDILLITCWA
ncbi:UNVERIFIED_CONTAM: hypothetical protein Slati_2385100 [Sesamum latifolium]|uniref:Reverse transcriptase zinc-binding domain-containing protein n=1 Tax=Sesamum latifolium TaxID=2727402 RepID=A0AAW2WE64_9LAMI